MTHLSGPTARIEVRTVRGITVTTNGLIGRNVDTSDPVVEDRSQDRDLTLQTSATETTDTGATTESLSAAEASRATTIVTAIGTTAESVTAATVTATMTAKEGTPTLPAVDQATGAAGPTATIETGLPAATTKTLTTSRLSRAVSRLSM